MSRLRGRKPNGAEIVSCDGTEDQPNVFRDANHFDHVSTCNGMPHLIELPSGLVVNLDRVNRMVPSEGADGQSLTVHFAAGDFIILDSVDATALHKHTVKQGTGVSSQLKVAIFWIVILVAIALVYLSVRQTR